MLTGLEIERQVRRGAITLEPFRPSAVNPNSVNLTLADILKFYAVDIASKQELDCRKDNPTAILDLDDVHGLTLLPGVLYLGSTVEVVGSNEYVPMLEGRSSLARLGLTVHQTGGFVDLGFRGQLTLEITVVHPLRVYAGLEVCQVSFWRPEGEFRLYKGKYQGQTGPTSSRLHEETEG